MVPTAVPRAPAQTLGLRRKDSGRVQGKQQFPCLLRTHWSVESTSELGGLTAALGVDSPEPHRPSAQASGDAHPPTLTHCVLHASGQTGSSPSHFVSYIERDKKE